MKNNYYPITDRDRVVLYVAGYKPGYIEKAMTLSIKNILLCLEDGTPQNKKIDARYLVKGALSEFKDSDKNLSVRINSVYTNYWKDDLQAILLYRPSRIRVPMVNKCEDLQLVDKYVREFVKEQDYIPQYEVMIESREGLRNIKHIYDNNDNIYAFTIGGGDYYDDVKDSSEDPQQEVIDAKKSICKFCKENNIYCFDTTYMNYKDIEGYKKDCMLSKNMGFSGRSVIHPDQIKITIDTYRN
ncbi:citrate lyase subunit beta [Vallitalea longa]|uniref:Citrate lyase subunit beta n=1 Tax=Vallitalea longa TaxID=2936439 RepID=A0A9W6DFA2_9FIRM|nr:aldolase/citrate lyase family protein [Vallitalea longa]GKX31021.1 citrate lyase subunit beta [Vallitalea longa]